MQQAGVFRHLLNTKKEPFKGSFFVQSLISVIPSAATATQTLTSVSITVSRACADSADQSAQVLDTYGWILLKSGKSAKGKELLEKAVALAPNGLDIRYHLAVALLETGDKEKAKQELEMIVNDDIKFTNLGEAKKLLSQL